eukprot:m.976613 g.976613  ORF g.976613 m.976613 type:complete len:1321 (+) comp23946_c0_seq1:455-4417(+)
MCSISQMRNSAHMPWLSPHVYALILTLSTNSSPVEAVRVILQQHTINTEIFPWAICNDGSPATYYTNTVSEQPSQWIYILEGGGFCATQLKCAERSIDSPFLTSSRHFEYSSMTMHPDITRFGFTNRTQVVVIRYCSSDNWIGNKTTTFFNDSTNVVSRWEFRGVEVLNSVLTSVGMVDSQNVLLIGSSAGGIGVLAHARDTFRRRYPHTPIRLILDSIPPAPHEKIAMSGFLESIDMQMSDLDTQLITDTTSAFSVWGAPLNISVAHRNVSVAAGTVVIPCFANIFCMLNTMYDSILANSNPFAVFMVAPRFDLWTWSATGADTIELSTKNDYTDPEPILELYVTLGRVSQMFSPLGLSGRPLPEPPAIYAPSCATHVVLSALTNPVLPGLVPLQEDLAGTEEVDTETSSSFDGTMFVDYNLTEVYVGDASMQHMKIGGVSVLDAIEHWVLSNFTDQTSTIDSCNVINCNPTCLATVDVRIHFDINGSIDTEIIFLGSLYIVCAFVWLGACLLGRRSDAIFLRKSVDFIPPMPKSLSGSVKRNGDRRRLLSSERAWNDTDVEAVRPRQRRATPLSIALPVHNDITTLAGVAENGKTQGVEDLQEDSHSENTLWVNDVSFEVQGSDGPKRILDHVTVTFKPGLTAIMGPTGSGKTSLLDAMVRNLYDGTVFGEILMGNTDISKASRQSVKDEYGYVMQLAAPWDPRSTARQVLMYQGLLRLSHLMPPDAVHDRIASVVAILKMEEFLDTVVGSAFGGGLSGGEKRKLAIVIQILSVPQFLILDEPTSGLDAASTLDVLQTLRWLGQQGHTVILSIHQPRPECWNMFEKVVLLGHGRICFSGKVDDVRDYMATLVMNDSAYQKGIFKPNNPADSILDALQHDGVEAIAHTTHANLASTKRLEASVAQHVLRCSNAITSSTVATHLSGCTAICHAITKHLNIVSVVNRRLMHATAASWKSTTATALLVPLLAAAVLYRNTTARSTAIAILVLTGAGFTVSFNRRSLVMFQHCDVVRFDIYEGVVKNWQFVVALYGWYGSAVFLYVGGTCCLAFQFVFGWDITAWLCFKFWVLLVTFEIIIGGLYIALLGIPKITEEVSSTLIFCIFLFEVVTAGFMVPKEQLDESMGTDVLVSSSMMHQAIAPVVFDLLHDRKFCDDSIDVSCSGDAVLIATGFDDQNPKLGISILIGVVTFVVLVSFAHPYISHAFAKIARFRPRPSDETTAPTATIFSLEEVVCTLQAVSRLDRRVEATVDTARTQQLNQPIGTGVYEKNQRFRRAVKRVIAQLPEKTSHETPHVHTPGHVMLRDRGDAASGPAYVELTV